ncbi:MAG: divalent-cation tolerance protein CutA [Bacteroidota bacterium]
MAFLCFYVTHPNAETAQKISRNLIDRKLVACANQFSMESAYWWQGAVAREGEIVTMLKTVPENKKAVEVAIVELHPYEVPCIMSWEVEANTPYENWIRDVTVVQDPV